MLSPKDMARALAAAISLIALVGLALSLSLPLLAVEMERMGTSGFANGASSALAGGASIVIAPFVPRLARRFGVGPLLAVSIGVAAATLLLFKLTMNYWAWLPLRFLYSCALATLFILSEFWISAVAPSARRGFIFGIYASVLSLGFAIGPTVLAVVGTEGWVPYLTGVALLLAAAAPLLFARGLWPSLEGGTHHGIMRYVRLAPLAAAAGLASGAVETGAIGMLPVLGLRLGQEAATAALLVSAVAIGNVITQVPIGWLSDRVDRRLMLLVVSLLVIVASVGIVWSIGANNRGLFLVLLIWGGFTGAFYTLGLAHLAARFKPADLVGANAAFVIMFNVGQMAGPPLIGAGVDLSTRFGFALATSAFAALVVLVALVERVRREPVRS